MAWNISTGMRNKILAATPQIKTKVEGITISFGDGDGTGGTDTINDTANQLASFGKHDFILISSGDVNNNILVKALTVAVGKIEVIAGSFAAVAAGGSVQLLSFESGGSIGKMLENGTMDLYTDIRPSNADLTESGVKLLPVTLNGAAFVGGLPTNGLNLETIVGETLKRAVDPETGATEVWRGAGVADGTVGWGRWYANDKVTGATLIGVHMDGVASTSGADINMANGTTIATGINTEVTDVNVTINTA